MSSNVSISYERHLLEYITGLFDEFLLEGSGGMNDMGKILTSLYNTLRIRYKKSLADPFKLKTSISHPPHLAIALKVFIGMHIELNIISTHSYEGNELLKIVAIIDQQYL